jgi:L-alanine-DL-glutamate epimerase-like enolase superfamily enzyme
LKIQSVDVKCYRWPRPKPISNGRFTYPDATRAVVEIRTDSGLSGIGLGPGLPPTGGEAVVKALVELMRQFLVGRDPINTERLWDELWQPKLLGRRGVETRVLSMVDIALWDIKAKSAGLPLYRMLGGHKSGLPAYIAGGYYEDGKGLQQLAEEMLEHLSYGVSAVKMKIGRLTIHEDIARVEAVREAIGPDVKLLTDANGAYSVGEARRVARALEPLDVFWFEEPVVPDDYAGHAEIAGSTSVPIAAGENEYTRYGFRDLMERGRVAVINPDAEILGGVTEFLKVAALAQAHSVPIAPHGHQHLHVHLACAIPNGLLIEYYRPNVDPFATEIMLNSPVLRDGYLIPTEEPGHGIVIDEKLAEKFRVL